jgi:hypothetical protein
LARPGTRTLARVQTDEIIRRRMHNQRLWGPPFDSLERVLGWLGAMQAQEFAAAKWSVAQRAAGVDHATVARAFDDGAILRTHVLRPTWHFVLPEDIRWMLGLTAPRIHARNASMYRQLEIDGRVVSASNEVIAQAVADGRHRTRKQLASVLEDAGISATGLRLAGLVMHAELDALICSGVMKGKQHTYALLEERAPAAGTLDRDEALAELTTRYFTSRGPATVKDFSRWSSLTMTECRRGLDMVGSQLEQRVAGDRTYWYAPASLRPKRSKVIDLVQGYDEVIMSYSESKDVLRAPSTPWDPMARPPLLHAVLLDGRLIGHWKPVVKRDEVTLETELHRRLEPPEHRALAAAVKRYGAFLGAPASPR